MRHGDSIVGPALPLLLLGTRELKLRSPGFQVPSLLLGTFRSCLLVTTRCSVGSGRLARVLAPAGSVWKIPATSSSELLKVQRTPCLLLSTSLPRSSLSVFSLGHGTLGDTLGRGGLEQEEREVLGLWDFDQVSWPGWTNLPLEIQLQTWLADQGQRTQ